MERRRHLRFPCSRDASVRLRSGAPARLLDLGRGGLLVESSIRLAPGATTAVAFGAGDAFRVQARIKRVFVANRVGPPPGEASLRYRAGLEFAQLSHTEAAVLESFVSRATGGGADADSAGDPTTKPGPQVVMPARTSADTQIFIRFPRGWPLTARTYAVVAYAPEQRGYVLLGTSLRPPHGDLCEFARASMQGAGFSVLHCEPADLNGLAACLGFYTGWLDDVGAVMVEAAHVVLHNQTYLVAGVASWTAYESVRSDFFATISSFGGEPVAEASASQKRLYASGSPELLDCLSRRLCGSFSSTNAVLAGTVHVWAGTGRMSRVTAFINTYRRIPTAAPSAPAP
jgi:hypothetical protein